MRYVPERNEAAIVLRPTRARYSPMDASGRCPLCNGVLVPVMTPRGPGWRCSCR